MQHRSTGGRYVCVDWLLLMINMEVIRGVAVLIARDFAVQITWLPGKLCSHRVCAYECL